MAVELGGLEERCRKLRHNVHLKDFQSDLFFHPPSDLLSLGQ